jgi:hypothetical protein
MCRNAPSQPSPPTASSTAMARTAYSFTASALPAPTAQLDVGRRPQKSRWRR